MTRNFLYENIGSTKNFYWYEALYQNRWKTHVIPPDYVLKNILKTAQKAQMIRNFLQLPMLVTSWYRVPAYNVMIGGAEESAHTEGKGLDFMCPNLRADEVRKRLKPKLKEFDIRMENLPGASWVHVDWKPVGTARFFRP